MAGPPKQAHSYSLLIYGSEAGYLSSRAQIQLSGHSPEDTIAFVRFCDPDVTFPLDTYDNDIVTMYLPTSMLEPALNILRTEKFVQVYFGPAQGFIDTGNLPIGARPRILPPVVQSPTGGVAARRKKKKLRSQGRSSSAR